MTIENQISLLEQFSPMTLMIGDVIRLLTELKNSPKNKESIDPLIEPLRRQLRWMMDAQESQPISNKNNQPLTRVAYDTLVMLTELHPLNETAEDSQPLDPITQDLIPKYKKIGLSTGYLYNIDNLNNWLAIREVDPLTNTPFSRRELDHIQQVTTAPSELLSAAKKGDLYKVRELLTQERTDPNTTDPDGRTPLFIASREGHLAIVQTLLTVTDIKVNQARVTGATPFYIACEKGHLDVVCALLDAPGIDPFIPRLTGGTALCVAADTGHVEVVRKLLTLNGATPNPVNNKGGTPLMFASKTGLIDVVYTLLNAEGINPHLISASGHTAFCLAVENNRINVVRALLAVEGINVHQAPAPNKTPLALAANNDYAEILQTLLEHYFNLLIKKPNSCRQVFLENSLLLDELVRHRDQLWLMLNTSEDLKLLNTIYASREETEIIRQHPLYRIFTTEPVGNAPIIGMIAAKINVLTLNTAPPVQSEHELGNSMTVQSTPSSRADRHGFFSPPPTEPNRMRSATQSQNFSF